MNKNQRKPAEPEALRRGAEERLRTKKTEQGLPQADADSQRHVHELQVHQIELERQNEELRRARQELEASRAKYCDLYDRAPVGYAVLSEAGLMLEANLAAARLLGIERARLIKQPLARFIVREDADAFHLHCQRLFETGARQTCELRMAPPDETPVWVRMDAEVARDNEAGPLLARVALLDITASKRAEEALLFARFSLDNADDTMVCVDRDARFIDVNEAFCRASGYSREELLSMSVHDIDPAYSAEIWSGFWEELKQSGSLKFESRHRTKEGRFRPVEIAARFLKYNGKEYHCAFARDLTERKRAEQVLRESEATLQAMVDASPQSFALIDTEGVLLIANRAMASRVNMPPADLVGRRMYDFFPPEVAQERRMRVQEAIRTGRLLHFEDERAGRYLDNYYQPILDPQGKVTRLVILAIDITERRQAEEEIRQLNASLEQRVRERTAELEQATAALRVSEEKFRSYFEGAPVAVLVSDLEGLVLDCNPAATDLLGYDAATLKGMNVLNLHPEEDRRAVRQALETSRRSSRVEGEFRIERSDGTAIWVLLNVSLTASGHALGFFRDITERKQAEAALRSSEQRNRMVLRTAMDGFWRVDLQGRLLEVNEAYCRMSGYSEQELLAMSIPKLEAVETSADMAAHLRRVMAQGADRFESRHRHKDGSSFPVEVSVQYEATGEGHMFGFLRNITARKQAEAALHESEEKWRTIFEESTDGLLLADPKTRTFRNANRAICRMLGYSKAELQSFGVVDLHRPADLPAVLDVFQRHARGELKVSADLPMLRKDGTVFYADVTSMMVIVAGEDLLLGAFRDITERKRAAEALRRENTFRQAVIERAAEGLCLCHNTADFPFVAFTIWNARMREITGYTMEEINRRGWYQAMYPDPALQAKARTRMDRMRQGDDLIAEEWEITRADGQKRTVFLSTSVVDGGSDTVHVLALCHDVTERKRAEARLRESEERYRVLVELSPEAIVVHREGKFTYVNQAAATMAGASSPAELIGRPVMDFVHRDCREVMQERMRCAYEQRVPTPLQASVFHRLDGQTFNAEVTGVPITLAGETTFLTLVRDITERKRADEMLQESETRYRNLVEMTPDAIAIQQQGKFVYVNPAAVKLLGAKATQELVGKPILDVVHPAYRNRVVQLIRQTAEGENAPLVEEKLMKLDGTAIDVEVAGIPFTHHGKAATQVIVREITARKQAEEKLRRFTHEIIAVREEEKKQVAAAMHHDVGSLAVGLGAYFDMIEKEIRAGRTAAALQRMKRTKKLLSASLGRLKVAAVQLRPPELDLLGLQATLRQHFVWITEHTGARIHFQDDLGRRRVTGDTATILFRLVQETLTNAIRHGRAKQVEVRLALVSGTVTLTVWNNGREFDPSAPKPGAASLLGLRISRETVELAGGPPTVDSGQGKGTTMRASLPLAKSPPPPLISPSASLA